MPLRGLPSIHVLAEDSNNGGRNIYIRRRLVSARRRQDSRDCAGRHPRGGTRLNSCFSRPFVNCLCQLLLAEATLFINQNQWAVGMKNSPSQPAEERGFRSERPLFALGSHQQAPTPSTRAGPGLRLLPHPPPPHTHTHAASQLGPNTQLPPNGFGV